jgi:ubiquinone/menaquinone biosynthesis C-methylase UbiE
MPRICNYERSHYRTDFWGGAGRAYEDGAERAAMSSLLPQHGRRLLEVGSGFGRLAPLYLHHDRVVLTDYAASQLQEAKDYLGGDTHFDYVVADIYHLPFANESFETLATVRVMHHLTAVPAALAELRRMLPLGGTAIIEYASKFHWKSLLRWLLGGQAWSPFDHAPLEFVELNFNFHPAWMRQQFETAGLRLQTMRTVSHFRIGLLKRLVPTALLVTLDAWAQRTGNLWQLTPSIIARLEKGPRVEE